LQRAKIKYKIKVIRIPLNAKDIRPRIILTLTSLKPALKEKTNPKGDKPPKTAYYAYALDSLHQ
jgi:hypothetical protein